jgi:beta-glucosidase
MALLSLSLIIPIMYGQDGMTYKNSSYSALERAKDLLRRMTWEEKIGQMGGVRVLLGANLTFNETTYNSIHELQNGILGNFSDSLMLPYTTGNNAKPYLSLRLQI